MSVTQRASVGVAEGGGTVIRERSTSTATSYQCEPPAPEDACFIEAYRDGAATKGTYRTGGRNLLLGVGYLAWVIPGLLMHSAFEAARADEISQVDASEAQSLNACAPRAATSPDGLARVSFR